MVVTEHRDRQKITELVIRNYQQPEVTKNIKNRIYKENKKNLEES